MQRIIKKENSLYLKVRLIYSGIWNHNGNPCNARFSFIDTIKVSFVYYCKYPHVYTNKYFYFWQLIYAHPMKMLKLPGYSGHRVSHAMCSTYWLGEYFERNETVALIGLLTNRPRFVCRAAFEVSVTLRSVWSGRKPTKLNCTSGNINFIKTCM